MSSRHRACPESFREGTSPQVPNLQSPPMSSRGTRDLCVSTKSPIKHLNTTFVISPSCHPDIELVPKAFGKGPLRKKPIFNQTPKNKIFFHLNPFLTQSFLVPRNDKVVVCSGLIKMKINYKIKKVLYFY